MDNNKEFLTYNQQMKKLRGNKKIDCNGSNHKKILIRAGYFNIINGYKNPFVSGTVDGKHRYIPGTSIDQIYMVKQFDDSLRSFLLKYITQIEEEIRTLAGYKFDECNERGTTYWFDTHAYSPRSTLKDKMQVISCAYSELGKSHLEYVRFYMDNHKSIPTWIMIKVINFSTFINVLKCCKQEVPHSICKLYDLLDDRNLPNIKLLIGSLHWMRKIRNSCAHNERIYCLSDIPNTSSGSGRIIEKYFRQLPNTYCRKPCQKNILDLLVYFKYYLPCKEYEICINEFNSMLYALKEQVHSNAFDYIRGRMGIKNLEHLQLIKNFEKTEINYNKFDTYL